MDVAVHIGLTYGSNNIVVDNWMKFQNAVRCVTNREEGRKICEIIYVSLNFVINYREQMATAVLAFCKLKIMKEDNNLFKNTNTKTRKKRSFILKLISQMQTDERKLLNGQAERCTGFSYTKQNPDGDDSRYKGKIDVQRHLKFYDWMIMGAHVSFRVTKSMINVFW